VYTPPTRRDSTVSSRRRRRCVLGSMVRPKAESASAELESRVLQLPKTLKQRVPWDECVGVGRFIAREHLNWTYKHIGSHGERSWQLHDVSVTQRNGRADDTSFNARPLRVYSLLSAAPCACPERPTVQPVTANVNVKSQWNNYLYSANSRRSNLRRWRVSDYTW